MRRFGRRRAGAGGDGNTGSVDALLVGLGNPGARYAGTRHNIGFDVAEALIGRWELSKPKKKFGGLVTDGRTGPGGPRVAVLLPQTFMNLSGDAAGPARGSFGVELDRVIAIHDEIDLPFGEIKTKVGGGAAGHNGLKSLDKGLGSREYRRIRVGVGRPESTDPEIVSGWVLGRFNEGRDAVTGLIDDAVRATERLLEEITSESEED